MVSGELAGHRLRAFLAQAGRLRLLHGRDAGSEKCSSRRFSRSSPPIVTSSVAPCLAPGGKHREQPRHRQRLRTAALGRSRQRQAARQSGAHEQGRREVEQRMMDLGFVVNDRVAGGWNSAYGRESRSSPGTAACCVWLGPVSVTIRQGGRSNVAAESALRAVPRSDEVRPGKSPPIMVRDASRLQAAFGPRGPDR